MNARDKANAAKLRRVSDYLFELEADRRGYSKINDKVILLPTRVAREYEDKLRERAMHMIEEPAHAVNDLATVRAMFGAAEWLKTFREMHENALAKKAEAAQ